MPTKTNEQALEAAIEKRLTGTCLEELKEEGHLNAVQERNELYRSGYVYYIGLLHRKRNWPSYKSNTIGN